jgi:hypothetical protein
MKGVPGVAEIHAIRDGRPKVSLLNSAMQTVCAAKVQSRRKIARRESLRAGAVSGYETWSERHG